MQLYYLLVHMERDGAMLMVEIKFVCPILFFFGGVGDWGVGGG